jgi:hypothetical protein
MSDRLNAADAADHGLARAALQVLWPAFLMAGVLEMLVFSVVDPSELRGPGGALLGWPPAAIYTLGFLLFWLVIASACAGTVLLSIDVPGDAADDVPPTTPWMPPR